MFKGGGLSQEAFEEAVLMLQASHSMHRDAVAALHKKGVLTADIYERDRQLNKYERSVRRKVLTHLTVAPKPDINMGLVITAIIIDIERIGDYTKNIVELAAGSPEPFDGGELTQEIVELEKLVDGMFRDLTPALQGPDEDLARKILKHHKELSARVEAGLQALRTDQALKGQSGRAVTAALYLRYLKRVSAHLKNVATSVVNPFHRIGFKEKKKKGRGAAPVERLSNGLEEDESRD
ncbi:phosphate uptake regulator PhoU [Gemmatimonadota bacterium]